VAQLYPQALGSLFVASYYSQGYGGGIRPRLHAGFTLVTPPHVPVYNLCTDGIENTDSSNVSVVAYLSFSVDKCLPTVA
jgi:hypothetical protein